MTTTPRYIRLATALALGAFTWASNTLAETYDKIHTLTGSEQSLTEYLSYVKASTFFFTLALVALAWVFTPQNLD